RAALLRIEGERDVEDAGHHALRRHPRAQALVDEIRDRAVRADVADERAHQLVLVDRAEDGDRQGAPRVEAADRGARPRAGAPGRSPFTVPVSCTTKGFTWPDAPCAPSAIAAATASATPPTTKEPTSVGLARLMGGTPRLPPSRRAAGSGAPSRRRARAAPSASRWRSCAWSRRRGRCSGSRSRRCWRARG